MSPSISERITYWQRRAKVSQSELARLAGVNKSVINRWVRGKNVPTQGSLDRLVRALGMNLPKFFGPLRTRQVRAVRSAA